MPQECKVELMWVTISLSDSDASSSVTPLEDDRSGFLSQALSPLDWLACFREQSLSLCIVGLDSLEGFFQPWLFYASIILFTL